MYNKEADYDVREHVAEVVTIVRSDNEGDMKGINASTDDRTVTLADSTTISQTHVLTYYKLVM